MADDRPTAARVKIDADWLVTHDALLAKLSSNLDAIATILEQGNLTTTGNRQNAINLALDQLATARHLLRQAQLPF